MVKLVESWNKKEIRESAEQLRKFTAPVEQLTPSLFRTLLFMVAGMDAGSEKGNSKYSRAEIIDSYKRRMPTDEYIGCDTSLYPNLPNDNRVSNDLKKLVELGLLSKEGKWYAPKNNTITRFMILQLLRNLSEYQRKVPQTYLGKPKQFKSFKDIPMSYFEELIKSPLHNWSDEDKADIPKAVDARSKAYWERKVIEFERRKLYSENIWNYVFREDMNYLIENIDSLSESRAIQELAIDLLLRADSSGNFGGIITTGLIGLNYSEMHTFLFRNWNKLNRMGWMAERNAVVQIINRVAKFNQEY